LTVLGRCEVRLRSFDPKPHTLNPDTVSLAAEVACLLEVSAPKPGNVTRFADFSDTRYIDFLASAAVIGTVLRKVARATTGSVILEVVRETARAVGRNTNLGIALLFAPLAKAALLGGRRSLRTRVHAVLASLTPRDGQKVYEAIRLASPGGLGGAEEFDVRTTCGKVSLMEAMRSAMERDSIASEYATDFEITFTIGAPALARFVKESGDPEASIIQTYLTLLFLIPDSLIARKCGGPEARRVSSQAGRILGLGGAFTEAGRQKLPGWDRALRKGGNRLNPGTTADLVASALFVVMLEKGIEYILGRKGKPSRVPSRGLSIR
jgi:triphosphoribosyl-dephospho-CoA synthase